MTEFLVAWIPQHDIGQGMIAQVERERGAADGGERLNAEWSVDWHGWTELIGQIAELTTERVQRLAVCDAADAQAIENDFMEEATAFVQAKLRQFYVLSDQNSPIPGRTDAERCGELRVQHGLVKQHGEVWGRNDCCADSLLQLLIEHGVLARTIDAGGRNVACQANRNALCAAPDALKPKAIDGTPPWRA